MSGLSEIVSLLDSDDASARARMAGKVGQLWSYDALTEAERNIIAELLQVAVEDTESIVRQNLMQHVVTAPNLPRGLLESLTRDKDIHNVAVPFIQKSHALTDDMLTSLVVSTDAARQTAIATRQPLSSVVSSSLVNYGTAGVLTALGYNHTADISLQSYQKMIERFPNSDAMHEALCYRKLPQDFSEKLVFMVSDSLKEQLGQTNAISPELLEKAIEKSRKAMALKVGDSAITDTHIQKLVRHLKAQSRLSDNLISRAACTGDLRFLECALSSRTDLPLHNIQKLIYDGGSPALQKLCQKAKIKADALGTIMQALQTHNATIKNCDHADNQHFSRLMLERLLTAQEGDNESNQHFNRLVEMLESGENFQPSSLQI